MIPAAAETRFQAFSWSHRPAPATSHVGQLRELAPWTDIPALARSLNTQPEGRRWVVIYCLTDSLANNTADRCVRRETRLVTRYLDQKSSSPSPSRAGSKLSHLAAPRRIPVTSREVQDVRTEFRGPWMDAGVQAVKREMSAVMAKLLAAGAKVDGFVMSNETNLGSAFIVGIPGTAAAISSDPRWPLLSKQLGLPLDIRTMNWGNDLYFKWQDVMAGRFDRALNEAVYAPIQAAYPRAVVSNYNSGAIRRNVAWPDINGHRDHKTTAGFGTHDSHEFYGWLAAGRVAKVMGSLAPSPAWMAFRLEVLKARGMIASSVRPRHAWIAARSWKGESWGRVAIAEHPLWDELVIQLGMHGFETMFEFSPEDLMKDPQTNAAQRLRDRAHLDGLLAQLNGVAADTTDRIIAPAQPDWDDLVIATGRTVRSGTLWRFSFDTSVEAVTLQLSDGTFIKIAPERGTQGCWLRLPAGKGLVHDAAGRRPVMQTHRADEIGALIRVDRARPSDANIALASN